VSGVLRRYRTVKFESSATGNSKSPTLMLSIASSVVSEALTMIVLAPCATRSASSARPG
jgi:hypothetical protein